MAKKKSITIEITADDAKAKSTIAGLKTLIEESIIKIKISADMKQVQSEINALKKPIQIKADTKKAKITIGELEKLLKTLKHEVKITADTTEAEKKIAVLKKPTSSTHTVTIVENFAKKLGGMVAPIHARLGGYFPGYNRALDSVRARVGRHFPGYGGGDKIPILGEAGEFMLRKESVRNLGLKAAQSFNRSDIPALLESIFPKIDARSLLANLTLPVQRIKEGSVVQSLKEGGPVREQSPSDTVNVNLEMGNKSFPMTSTRDTARDFVKNIRNLNIVHSRRRSPY